MVMINILHVFGFVDFVSAFGIAKKITTTVCYHISYHILCHICAFYVNCVLYPRYSIYGSGS